jgi:D-glycero-alpha-D-manno-heptose-7-phosphate kinase
MCHLAVDEGSEVWVRRWRTSGSNMTATADLHVSGFGDRYRFALDKPPGRHPLLEAVLRRWASPGWHIEVSVASSVPPGSSLGTSASVAVAMIAALRALAGALIDPASLARAAHEVETVDLELQSGVQDQIAAAYGGSNLIRMDAYPEVKVQTLELTPATWDALGRRILTIYLGSPHRSSAVHEAVIAHLSGGDRDTLLAPLRTAATDAATALVSGRLDAYGDAMITNTAAQAALHPALINPVAREVIAVAKKHGAVGWKVNGAGGEGGTVSLVGPDDPAALVNALSANARLTVLPLRPARKGARIVDQA